MLVAESEREDVAVLARGEILDDLRAAFSKSEDTSLRPLQYLDDDVLELLREHARRIHDSPALLYK